MRVEVVGVEETMEEREEGRRGQGRGQRRGEGLVDSACAGVEEGWKLDKEACEDGNSAL